MKILIDISPTKSKSKTRGIGFYTEQLVSSLKRYDKINSYQLFYENKKIFPKADIIHYPYFDFFKLTLPLIKKTKTIVTIHDAIPLIFPKKFPKGIRGLIKHKIQNLSLRFTNAVITDSHCSKKDIIKTLNFHQDKINVVYLAASEKFQKIKDQTRLLAVRKKYHLPQQFILYVGDANWNKNLLTLIEASLRIRFPLVLVGEPFVSKKFDRTHPENKPLIEIQQQIKNNKNIFALGFVDTDDLILIYNLAIVYCQPSFYEGFGLPILEAMSCGCPVVCSKTSSLPEVAGEAAEYFNPFSLNSVCKSIKKCLENKNFSQKLVELGENQSKKFSWKKTALETKKVYQKVLKD